MRNTAAIELGNENQVYGVVVPDLPGCFSAGDSLDEALGNAEEAILVWIDAMLDAKQPIPRPSSIDTLRAQHPEWADWVWIKAEQDLQD